MGCWWWTLILYCVPKGCGYCKTKVGKLFLFLHMVLKFLLYTLLLYTLLSFFLFIKIKRDFFCGIFFIFLSRIDNLLIKLMLWSMDKGGQDFLSQHNMQWFVKVMSDHMCHTSFSMSNKWRHSLAKSDIFLTAECVCAVSWLEFFCFCSRLNFTYKGFFQI